MSYYGHGYFIRVRILLAAAFFLLFALIYVVTRIFILGPQPNDVSYANSNFNVLGLHMPRNLNFCGEKLPSNDYAITRALEKEFFTSSYWKANSILLFNKASRWFPIIEPILKAHGVPDDFKYLAVIESHLSNATSPAGAAGFWQLVNVSAQNYGLEVNDYVDERYHVEKATVAACRHFREAHAIFRNWTLSAAAYNRGIGGIQNALRRQKTDNYFDLMLNPETGAFVYRIIAYKTLLTNPEHFGIWKKLRYAPKPAFSVVKVDSSISDLADFAERMGVSLITLRSFNPWILRNSLPNPGGKIYEIRIPKNKMADLTSYARDLLPDGDPIEKYLSSPALADSADVDTVLTRKILYEVKVDEPLDNLARFLKVKPEDLRKWNNLGESGNAVKGQTLTIFYRN
jgi:membrane-bound lytic murein transglycosylase D